MWGRPPWLVNGANLGPIWCTRYIVIWPRNTETQDISVTKSDGPGGNGGGDGINLERLSRVTEILAGRFV